MQEDALHAGKLTQAVADTATQAAAPHPAQQVRALSVLLAEHNPKMPACKSGPGHSK